ncbi:MAG: hypothetical protein KAG89_00395 [Fulvimarina manganoxydans]|uniref:hypothetical protein n=1 Tax=Fulvimarina manganoxydans TaxID=937218 RepID=UPI0023553F3C|nr:hypothetical protein [Fulvimarina manganoxydans]MCK5930605.1 hypothetical protein [Fulvimarina manganoxydans]
MNLLNSFGSWPVVVPVPTPIVVDVAAQKKDEQPVARPKDALPDGFTAQPPTVAPDTKPAISSAAYAAMVLPPPETSPEDAAPALAMTSDVAREAAIEAERSPNFGRVMAELGRLSTADELIEVERPATPSDTLSEPASATPEAVIAAYDENRDTANRLAERESAFA